MGSPKLGRNRTEMAVSQFEAGFPGRFLVIIVKSTMVVLRKVWEAHQNSCAHSRLTFR